MKIKEFQLVSIEEPFFTMQVNNLINKGFQLFDPMIIGEGKLYTQKMVKYEDEIKSDFKNRKIIEVKKKFIRVGEDISDSDKSFIANEFMSFDENFGFCLENFIMRDKTTLVLHMVKYEN